MKRSEFIYTERLPVPYLPNASQKLIIDLPLHLFYTITYVPYLVCSNAFLCSLFSVLYLLSITDRLPSFKLLLD